MGEVLQFLRRMAPWQTATCRYAPRGFCTAKCADACRCRTERGLPPLLSPGRDAGSIAPTRGGNLAITGTAIARQPWTTNLADPDLIAFAKSGGPIIDLSKDTP